RSVGCSVGGARAVGWVVRSGCGAVKGRRLEQGFELETTTGEVVRADRLLLATGGNQNGNGRSLAEQLGHGVAPPCPSLFTFECGDGRISDLAGISVGDAVVSVEGTKLMQRGPLLITHWGWSGPAILKLSAWGARILHEMDYRFGLRVQWVPGCRLEEMAERLRGVKGEHGGKLVVSWNPFGLPGRLWQSLCLGVPGVTREVAWAGVTKGGLLGLAEMLTGSRFEVTGKSLYKDEFVTCGGVVLKEIDFRTMGSRVCPGLYVAGELLDIDGVTGGFNFQSAWTTGWIAGKSMGQDV
ncbi:MAG TPA: aminoacetone oxidase family FAD-binding enzyme, partial [Kiritimatiellia bacterium]|nr:aminoacetone oxidase family FAD-binding enzyme [Kiritimatiellia bacterium]